MDNLDLYAKEYINPDKGMKVDEKFLEKLAKIVIENSQGPRVLEMGVGAGVYTDKIIKKFGHSYIVDGSKKLLDNHIQKYSDKVTTFHSYFEDFEPQIKFDTILATNILEHVEDSVLVLTKARGWLRDNGKIIIVVPNANSLHRKYGVCLGMQIRCTDLCESDIKIGHRRVYTIDSLVKDCEEAGLEVIKIHSSYMKFLSNSQMSDFTDKQLNGLFELARTNIELINYNADLFIEVKASKK